MKNNNFFKQFMIIGAGTFINLVLGIFSTPLITRIVAPEEYGQFSIFTMYRNIAMMVLCIGLDQALIRYYYEHEDIKYRKNLLYHCLILPIIVTVLVSTIIIGLYWLNLIQFEFDLTVMIILCIYVLTDIIYRFSQLIIRLEKKVKLYSLLQIIQKFSYIIIVLILCYFIQSKYLKILAFGTMASSMICMIISILTQKNMWDFRDVNNSEDSIPMRKLLYYAFPFILSMGITTVFQATDKIFLNWFGTYTEVGIYASTMSLVNIFAIIQTAFNTLWAPTSVEHYEKNPNDTNFHQHANQVITIVMFFVGISLILMKDVFTIILGEEYRQAAYILPFLIFNPIMHTISETTVAGLVFKNKSNLQVVVALFACLTNIAGNAILVPKLGCQGAAISTGISYIVFYYMRTLLGIKQYYVDFKLKKFTILTIIVSIYALYNTFIPFNIGSIIGYIICCAVMYGMYKDVIHWCIEYVLNIIKNRKLTLENITN